MNSLLQSCDKLAFDLDFTSVAAWKKKTGGKAVGYLPIYIPQEIIHAAGMLPVGIVGGGDRLEIIRGDAYFQSYICHIPRSTIELGVSGRLEALDGMLFPSICDVIRNLSGMWKILFPEKYVRYVDLPQNFDAAVGGHFYRLEMEQLLRDMEALAERSISQQDLADSIRVFNRNRALIRILYELRSKSPWEVPTEDIYLLLRAGLVLPVEEHNDLIERYLSLCGSCGRRPLDNARVIVIGEFCEQPPLGLIRTLERSGCYIVDDDFLLGSRWLLEDVAEDADPLTSLAEAFIRHSASTSSKYEPEKKGEYLVASSQRHRAEGVIFCAPSFCDPALLDQPMLTAVLDRAGIEHTSFKYSEDTGQFGVIREQAGTFADSIKLWSAQSAKNFSEGVPS